LYHCRCLIIVLFKYRLDSDIDYSYFTWHQKIGSTQRINNNEQSHLEQRQARAAVMISNCYSQNKREDYLERLSSVISITRIGHCSSNKCRKSREACLDQLADTHPFYLAFENSLCRDYATEKYANVIQNGRMIPIVFSRNSHRYIPNSFIDADDFSTPEELGIFLRELVNNQSMYESYFNWRTDFELVVPDENNYLCQLCQKLNNPYEPKKTYENMKQWLFEDAHCQQWNSKSNSIVDVPVDETMDYQDSWF
jgi:glycoprotein 3-alpha-L-fucosyltransferase